jgi:hypothetical protein
MVRRAVDRVTHNKETCFAYLFYGTITVLIVEVIIGLYVLGTSVRHLHL